MILFLDFDGVLHPETTVASSELFCRLPLLQSVLDKHPEVEIVISSTWRLSRTVEQLRQLFSAHLAARIVGATPRLDSTNLVDSLASYPRHREVVGWLREQKRSYEEWVVLDDKPWLFRPFLPNLLVVPGETGLTPQLCAQLHNRLKHSN